MNPTLHAQILTLRKYQAWRTGEDERTMDEAGIAPAAITSALDAVLDFAESHLRDATKKHATQACNMQPSEEASKMTTEELLKTLDKERRQAWADGYESGWNAAIEAVKEKLKAMENK